METVNYTCGSNVGKTLLILLLLVLLVWILFSIFNRSTEGFDYSQKDPVIQPTYYDADTRSIQTGKDFIKQTEVIMPWATKVDDTCGDITGIADYKMDNNKCSIHCCGDWLSIQGDNGLVPSSYYCSGDQNSGCLCLTKKQADFLDSRGFNNS
jgi:hypothetical protein